MIDEKKYNEIEKYSDTINSFLMDTSVFVVKQLFNSYENIIAIFNSKQEAEKYIRLRKGKLDYIIDTVQFCYPEEELNEVLNNDR